MTALHIQHHTLKAAESMLEDFLQMPDNNFVCKKVLEYLDDPNASLVQKSH